MDGDRFYRGFPVTTGARCRPGLDLREVDGREVMLPFEADAVIQGTTIPIEG